MHTPFAKKPADAAHKHPIAKAETGRPAEFPNQFRIPALPFVYDCVHVASRNAARGSCRPERWIVSRWIPKNAAGQM